MIHGRNMLSLTPTTVEMRQAVAWPAACMAATSWSNTKKSNQYITNFVYVCVCVCVHIYSVYKLCAITEKGVSGHQYVSKGSMNICLEMLLEDSSSRISCSNTSAYLREDLLVVQVTKDAQNALHGHEYMHQHDVGTRFRCVCTPQVWCESHLLHPVYIGKVAFW
jgi:hypothetical protein